MVDVLPGPSFRLPDGFPSRMDRLLKEEYSAFLQAYSRPPLVGLRVNHLKVSPADLEQLLPFHLEAIPAVRDGFLVAEPAAPGRHPYHAAGLYYLQEPSAMVPAEVLDPRPGELVLDLAAAPGGKSTQLAARMEGEGLLVANEIHPHRARDLVENIERLGIRHAVVTQEHPARLADRLSGIFDRVLVDAPCSGEGMFRRSAAAREEWTPGLVESCQRRQGLILDSAATMVRPGGWMVYSTCTFSPEENEGVVDGFLRRNRAFDLEDIAMQPGFSRGWAAWEGGHRLEAKLQRTVRLWPHRGPWEGHFVARLRRKEGDARPAPHKAARPRSDIQDLEAVDQFWRQHLGEAFPSERAIVRGEQVFLLPAAEIDLTGLRVLRPGWWIGGLRTNRFEPSHALAMAWPGGRAGRMLSFEVGSAQVSAYLRGEVLDIPGDVGWVIIAAGGYPLGWGKQIRGKVKNHYPHRLRGR
jgi:NOL1/NOP2/sun family putative RNA methylase